MRCDRKRFAKKYLGNQDLTNAFRYSGDHSPRLGMRISMNDDGQNIYSWKDSNNIQFNRIFDIIPRFIIKRVGIKFDDAYSEFINKHLKRKYSKYRCNSTNYTFLKKRFREFFDSNKFNIYLDDNGIIVREKDTNVKNKDIIIYHPGYDEVYSPIKDKWNLLRRILIPLIGYNRFDYYYVNELNNYEYEKLFDLIRTRITIDIKELLQSIKYFRNYDLKYNNSFWTRGILNLLYNVSHKRKIKKVYKYNTKEYWEHKKNQRRLNKQEIEQRKVIDKSFNDDLSLHNIKTNNAKREKVEE